MRSTTNPEATSSPALVDHRGAPYLALLAWLVVLVAVVIVGLEYVGSIESDPDCSWDSCLQPFVGPLFWLLLGVVIVGVGYVSTVGVVALLEFAGPAAQRARVWIAVGGPAIAVLGYLLMAASAALT